jgi:N-acetylglutamate synthase/N-acetylornithine aminotransferase
MLEIMERPSPEDRRIVPLQRDDRIEPPDNLTAAERKLFLEILQKCPPKQFSMADVYLLVSFTRATLTADRASKQLAKARSAPERNSWMKMMDGAMKLQAQLATKLRLATTARHDARRLSRLHASHRPAAYDLMTDDGDAS